MSDAGNLVFFVARPHGTIEVAGRMFMPETNLDDTGPLTALEQAREDPVGIGRGLIDEVGNRPIGTPAR